MWNWISKLEELRQQGQPLVMVTLTRFAGSTPRETGAKMIVLPDGKFFGTIGGGHLEELALKDAVCCLKEDRSQVFKYPLGAKAGQCCGGIVELLMEVINNGPRLYLFGAGHVGQAVCKTLSGTPFSVHVIDDREEWVESDEIPSDIIRHRCEWDEFIEEAQWDDRKTFVAVMTHRHDVDQAIIEEVVKRPARYIGLIGSESKWRRFRQRLAIRGVKDEVLNRVQCPMGLKTGGKAPKEIAISIAAQALQLHYEGNAPHA